jgi:Transcriptional regulator DIP2311-like, C-terminal domain
VPRSAREEFKPAQQRAVAVLKDGHEELTRGAYQEICGVSRSQAAYDLAELVEAGVLERIGGGRSTRYVLVREPNSSRRHWTSDRIRSELVRFCAGRPAWPSAHEFKSAGHTDLYVAASRYGGVAFWAAELGLPRASRRWEAASLPRLRLSLSWAMIGALGGALAVGAAVAIVQGFPRATPNAVAEHAGSVATAKSPTAKSSTRRARTSPKRATTAKARVNSRTKTSHAAVEKPSSSASTTPILAVRTVSSTPPAPRPRASSTTSSTRAGTTTTTSSSTGSGGPTPLMAPRGGSGTPPPLPPPTR